MLVYSEAETAAAGQAEISHAKTQIKTEKHQQEYTHSLKPATHNQYPKQNPKQNPKETPTNYPQ